MIYIKPIPDYPGYFACSNGKILGKRGFLRPNQLQKGYLQVKLYSKGIKRSKLVHRLVADSFLHRGANDTQLNHINGIKTDNRVENLEWCTQSENMKHAYRLGLKKNGGENSSTNKLTEFDVISIKGLLTDGNYTVCQIADRFDVSRHTIYDIKRGKTWRDVNEAV